MWGVEETQHLERVNTYRCNIYRGWTVLTDEPVHHDLRKITHHLGGIYGIICLKLMKKTPKNARISGWSWKEEDLDRLTYAQKSPRTLTEERKKE